MNREQMIAWLYLEGWEADGLNGVRRDDIVVVAVRSLQHTFIGAAKVGPEASVHSPNGMDKYDENALRYIVELIREEGHTWT